MLRSVAKVAIDAHQQAPSAPTDEK